ncbi:hypothetical protein QAD02_020802 [Eretmocerus hayati]|uniref:Uncharacterized protein n=1 Tax=Eretmocerus hayati TaxID=131215 RepID=A0ACC2PQZ1_9HYME|nr:hypothetical protein QAD02_020802 [Eretmocerus hayati]
MQQTLNDDLAAGNDPPRSRSLSPMDRIRDDLSEIIERRSLSPLNQLRDDSSDDAIDHQSVSSEDHIPEDSSDSSMEVGRENQDPVVVEREQNDVLRIDEIDRVAASMPSDYNDMPNSRGLQSPLRAIDNNNDMTAKQKKRNRRRLPSNNVSKGERRRNTENRKLKKKLVQCEETIGEMRAQIEATRAEREGQVDSIDFADTPAYIHGSFKT